MQIKSNQLELSVVLSTCVKQHVRIFLWWLNTGLTVYRFTGLSVPVICLQNTSLKAFVVATGAYPPGPPPGQYPPQQPGPPPTTVVVTQPVTLVQHFREAPVHTKCPHCQAEVVTGVNYETGTFTWLVCFALCVFG